MTNIIWIKFKQVVEHYNQYSRHCYIYVCLRSVKIGLAHVIGHAETLVHELGYLP